MTQPGAPGQPPPTAPSDAELAQIEADAVAFARGAGEILLRYFRTNVEVEYKGTGKGDPVSVVDRESEQYLHAAIHAKYPGHSVLGEEGANHDGDGSGYLWVVDPLDGTQEFVAGIPEWCISIGLVENGQAVAGGVCNPATGELFLGGVGLGVTLNGRAVAVGGRRDLQGAEVLASRSEVRRGEWGDKAAPFRVRPVGSVAYKLALVAAGLTDATWTLSPKHEWDVAGGAALVLAAGGEIRTLDWEAPIFNLPHPWLSGLVATSGGLSDAVRSYIGR